MKGLDRLEPAVLDWDALDTQHQLLFEACNRLETLILAGKGETGLAGWLQEQWALFAVHFALEEGLMAEKNYPGLHEHRRQHDVVLDKLRTLDDACGRQLAGTASDALEFIRGWDAEHRDGPDRKFEEFLKRWRRDGYR